MKRAAAISAILLAALLSGCASMFEGDYSTTTRNPIVPDSQEEDQIVLEVRTPEELEQSLLTMIEGHETYASLRFSAYEGNPADDVASICAQITNDTPVGSYAVYYIDYSLNKIVSYYEAEVSIIYKRTRGEMEKIITLTSQDQLTELLRTALSEGASSLALYTEEEELNYQAIYQELEDLYYSDPSLTPYMPEVSAASYPGEGVPAIMEVSFSYPYSRTLSQSRLSALSSKADDVVAGLEGRTGDEALGYLSETLADLVEYDSERDQSSYSRWYNSLTAYGALVLHKAAGEGYAMAMKLVCDRAGLECLVIRGRLNGSNHAWNLVKLENGSWYHLDIPFSTGSSRFLTDQEVMGEYWWDTAEYPQCSGPPLLTAGSRGSA